MEENKIYDILIKVRQITDEEVAELHEVIREQQEYINPLRMGTSGRSHRLAEHNEAVLNALLNLKKIIERGAHI